MLSRVPHALTLAIETSNPSSHAPGLAGELALGTGEHIATEPVGAGDGHEDDLAAAIDRLCRREGIKPDTIRRVAVSIGPGGFTALRIAVGTARMMAESLGVEVVPVPSTDVVAAGADPALTSFAVALTSKRGTAWIARYTRPAPGAPFGINTERPPRVMTAADLAAAHAETPLLALFADAHLDPSLRSWAEATRVPIRPPIFSARALLRLSATPAAIPAEALVPLYPREPEAVTKWRELGRPVS